MNSTHLNQLRLALFSKRNARWHTAYCVNSLLWNDGGNRFLDMQFTAGIEPRAPNKMIAPWFALEFSGTDSESRLRQGRQGTHVVWSAAGTRSSVVFDIDHDGDLDIVTNEFNARPQVFRNESKPTKFLKVLLEGTASGKSALGAIVVVQTAAGQQRQVNNGASGYLSQSVMPLYFGLGDQPKYRS